MSETALERAVDIVGSQSAFAKFLGVSQPSVWAWIAKGKPLPAEHVLKTEARTGISRHELRPDLYPVDGEASLVAGGPQEWPLPPISIAGLSPAVPEADSQRPFVPGSAEASHRAALPPTCSSTSSLNGASREPASSASKSPASSCGETPIKREADAA